MGLRFLVVVRTKRPTRIKEKSLHENSPVRLVPKMRNGLQAHPARPDTTWTYLLTGSLALQ
jgi:hypothetical protein